jgi:hypothetical protein
MIEFHGNFAPLQVMSIQEKIIGGRLDFTIFLQWHRDPQAEAFEHFRTEYMSKGPCSLIR